MIDQKPAIKITNLTKSYKVFSKPSDSFFELVTGKQKHIRVNALENINLELRRGEIIGVLGRNGAGKSTLLKMIAGTLKPSSGALEVNGRLTAILELGTGFQPHYTGRENIYMGGMCLGMSRAEIDSKINSIIAFSELEDVIDQPFKTYSTGMQARLTFSTAISVDPDILIIDEALSVGDARFQMKCFAWLQKLREQKATILLVSHDTNTMTTICDHALILEGGRVYDEGDPKQVCENYQRMLFGDKIAVKTSQKNMVEHSTNTKRSEAKKTTKDIKRYGSGEATLFDWDMLDNTGMTTQILESGSKFKLYFDLECHRDIVDLSCGFAIKDRRGTVVWGLTNLSANHEVQSAKAGQVLRFYTEGRMWLAEGNYFVTLGAAHIENGDKIDFIEEVIQFKVTGPGKIFTTSLVNLQTDMKIKEIDKNLRYEEAS